MKKPFQAHQEPLLPPGGEGTIALPASFIALPLSPSPLSGKGNNQKLRPSPQTPVPAFRSGVGIEDMR